MSILSAHDLEQVKRFVRITFFAALPSLVTAIGGHFDAKTLLALLVPALEVAYRQVNPATSDSLTGSAEGDAAP